MEGVFLGCGNVQQAGDGCVKKHELRYDLHLIKEDIEPEEAVESAYIELM